MVWKVNMVTWYLFQNALMRHRTVDALILFTSLIDQGGRLEKSDERLSDFTAKISPLVFEYVLG
jgi:hypothetical protein